MLNESTTGQFFKDSVVYMYADDASLCYQSSDMTQLCEAINNDLNILDTWLQGSKLTLNVAKTYPKLLCTKQKRKILKSRNESVVLKIRDNELDEVQNTKYLGVQIDSSLDWKERANQSSFH